MQLEVAFFLHSNVTAAANAEVITSFGKNGDNDPNKQLRLGGVGMTSVQGTGQTGIRTSAFKKAVLGNAKNAQSFPREGMSPVSFWHPFLFCQTCTTRTPVMELLDG